MNEAPSGEASDRAGENGGTGDASSRQASENAGVGDATSPQAGENAGIGDASSRARADGADGARIARTGPVLSLRQAAKAFGAVQALVDGSIDLYPGEAHGLVGENGAGKSTLVKILGGVYQPDAGELLIGGEPVTFAGPASARAAGVAIIYQEPNPSRPARGLSVADQQIVEIAKALSLEARVLVMDEPTAALTSVEVDRLFNVMAALRRRGTAVLFISHRLEEVFASCQRVTIMRDGRFVLAAPVGELDIDTMIRAMIGRELGAMFHKTGVTPGEVVLQVEHLGRENVFADISFAVRRGEIVALAGLVGAGRTEVARAVFGIDRRTAGSVQLLGKPLPNGQPTAAMAAGVAFVPEDRRQQGLVMDLGIDDNVALASLARLRRGGLIFRSAERKLAITWAKRLQVRYGWIHNAVATLSGGNQQKVVLGKWLARQPALLIIDEPTRGIDVGTKAEVHRILDGLAADGVAVLMISSELPEVLGVADRILVLHEGRLTAEFDRADATADKIMRAATGQARKDAA